VGYNTYTAIHATKLIHTTQIVIHSISHLFKSHSCSSDHVSVSQMNQWHVCMQYSRRFPRPHDLIYGVLLLSKGG